MGRRHLSCLFSIALAMNLANPAHAGDKGEAKERFEKGVTLFNKGSYDGALVEFKAAYEAEPHYKVLYNIGMTLYHLNRFVEAQPVLEQYLDEGGKKIDKQSKLEVQGILYEIDKFIGSVIVVASVDGAEVVIDGKVAASTPMTAAVKLDVGEHQLVVRLAGYYDFTDTVSVPGGKDVIVNAKLVPASAPPPATTGGDEKTAEPAAPPPTTGSVIIICWPEGTPIMAGENQIGTCPAKKPIHLEPGQYEITIEADYYEPYSTKVSVTAGSETKIDAELERPADYPHKAQSMRIGGSMGFLLPSILWEIGVVVPALKWKDADASTRDRYKVSLIVCSIGFASFWAAGITLIVLGNKKEKRWKAEWRAKHGSEVSLLPWLSPVEGGAAGGLVLTF